MNRKYPKVVGYWVYSIQIPSIGKFYIGVSCRKECSERWLKNRYKGSSLEPYLDEWDSMIKTVLIDNLTKEQAYQYEDNIIRALKMNNLCINERRSGLITSDKNAYKREFYKTNEEFREKRKKKERERYHKNMLNEEFREKERKRSRERRAKKKLKKQQQEQLTLFDLESFDLAS